MSIEHFHDQTTCNLIPGLLLAGKYVENHGVIHNMWFNTSTGQKLPYYNTQGVSSWWDNGSLPIWITAQRQVRQNSATLSRGFLFALSFQKYLYVLLDVMLHPAV